MHLSFVKVPLIFLSFGAPEALVEGPPRIDDHHTVASKFGKCCAHFSFTLVKQATQKHQKVCGAQTYCQRSYNVPGEVPTFLSAWHGAQQRYCL